MDRSYSMTINDELLDFIHASPTAFHAVSTVQGFLEKQGYEKLAEQNAWDLVPGGKYFVIRNHSSLIAFHIPREPLHSFMIGASHSDSPMLKIKPNPEIKSESVIRLDTERYGGMLAATWFDRPLTCAGCVCVRSDNGIEQRLIHIDRDLFVIPSLAIHMDRQVNEGHAYDFQKELLPIFRTESSERTFLSVIAEAAGTAEDDVLSYDLYVVQNERGRVFGAENEFICAPRLDDLQCAFADLKGFLQAEETSAAPVYVLFDNEEVGSLTKQGAAGTFLQDVLDRVLRSLKISDIYPVLSNSFIVSSDNAHAVHPAHPEKADPALRPHMNGGIVIKHSAAQLYSTDAISSAVFKTICERAGVPFQEFANHSNIRGGSTLGHLLNSHLSMYTADIGLPQLAMHSCFETAGAADTQYLIDAMKEFYSSVLHAENNTLRILK